MADFFDDPGAGAPPAAAPTPSAPSGGGGADFFGGQIPEMNIKGIKIQFPNVNTTAQLSQDQGVAKASQDLKARLNDFSVAVTAQQARDKNTTLMDKVIGHAVGLYYGRDPYDDPLAGEKGSIWRQHRQYQPGGGYPVERGAVFANAGSTRQAIQAWIMAQAKTRNYKALTDVQNHIPYETDTDELFQQKMEFWRHRLAETDAEVAQRGIHMPDLGVAPSGGYSEPSGGPAGGYMTPPPFRVKSQRMVGDTLMLEDDTGKWWYWDKRWVRYGG